VPARFFLPNQIPILQSSQSALHVCSAN
jgi:hypothetical protein